MHYRIRYDLRNPDVDSRPFEVYYAQFLEQVEWADANGFDQITLSEHHFVDDGYLPSLLPLAAAVAARTTRIKISLNLVLLPLKHPVQVAEDAAIVDIISGGRLELVLGAGYRINEFEGFGISRRERPSRMEEGIEIIRRCWEEDEFSFEGRHWRLKSVRVSPKPVQKPRPRIIMGGNSEAAARRAARIADAFYPAQPRWMTAYRDELVKLGKDPGPPLPASLPHIPLFLHVARDPDTAWEQISPYARYEVNEYGKFLEDDPNIPYHPVEDADALRAAGTHVVYTPEETVALGKAIEQKVGTTAQLGFHPLMGGMPYALGQESLELVAKEVMPHFS